MTAWLLTEKRLALMRWKRFRGHDRTYVLRLRLMISLLSLRQRHAWQRLCSHRLIRIHTALAEAGVHKRCLSWGVNAWAHHSRVSTVSPPDALNAQYAESDHVIPISDHETVIPLVIRIM